MKKLGFGTMRLPLLDPEDAKTIDYEQMKRMVDAYLEAGFTYFDIKTKQCTGRKWLVKMQRYLS